MNHADVFVFGCFCHMKIDQSWTPHHSRMWMSITSPFVCLTYCRMYLPVLVPMCICSLNDHPASSPRGSASHMETVANFPQINPNTIVPRQIGLFYIQWNQHNSLNPKACNLTVACKPCWPFFSLFLDRYKKNCTMYESLSIFISSSSQFHILSLNYKTTQY